MSKKQQISILGSTGSIGTQTLEVIASYPERFEVVSLSSNNNWQLLAQQAIEFGVDSVVIANVQHYENLTKELASHPIKVYCGSDALEQIVSNQNVDCVVSALVGFAGLGPTIAAIKSSKRIALANKETLVVAGEIVMNLAREHKATILPVDSEHSAIFQCLVGELCPIEKLILTASGGPFWGMNHEQLKEVTVKQALNHPNWSMGNKITIDSATLMNKGLEVIEARWLFDILVDKIEVVVHRSSVIHSMVQFKDGAIKAQLGSPNMCQPIQYALSFPYRLPMEHNPRLNLIGMNLEFNEVDNINFPCLGLAYRAIEMGGDMPCIMNAANEIAVSAFLEGKISFVDIPKYIELAMKSVEHSKSPTLDSLIETDAATREFVTSKIDKHIK